MRAGCGAVLLLLAYAASAPASDWGVLGIDGAGVTQAAQHDQVDPATMAAWLREATATADRLGLNRSARPKASGLLLHPLRQSPGLASSTRIGITNFVDLNPAFPERLRDYECGTRTYDTAAGYNHKGIDYLLWPFAWQGMAQETVAATAAASGTIVQRVDGNFDRRCSFDATTAPNRVMVAHDDGTLGIYLHFKNGGVTTKGVGERVEAGEFLGWIGSSGISTVPHLHFELHTDSSATSPVLDPNHGQCNLQPSRWGRQPAYREPRLEMVGVHSARPEFYFESCSTNERPNFSRHFAPGDTLYVAGYYADQPAGRISTVVLKAPDGRELSRITHAPTSSDLGGRDAYSLSYWTFRFTVPSDAAPGLYSAEVNYEGRTLRQSFAVGGPIYRASGLWYDPAQSGHGFTTEVVDVGGRAHLAAIWFAYLDGEPRFMFGLGEIVDNAATVPLRISTGGQFPPAFEPTQLQFESWGEARFTFDGLDTGRVTWSSTYPGFNDGQMPLSRLARSADINLDDESSGLRACTSGSWYVPAQSGHGLQLQVAEIGGQRLLLATWYAYHEGKQFWLSGSGPIEGKRAVVTLQRTRGADFPPAFDPAAVVRETWGTATLEFIDPLRLRLSWQSAQPGFSAGSLELSRLTQQLTASCL